jgi:hypothetical protein
MHQEERYDRPEDAARDDARRFDNRQDNDARQDRDRDSDRRDADRKTMIAVLNWHSSIASLTVTAKPPNNFVAIHLS